MSPLDAPGTPVVFFVDRDGATITRDDRAQVFLEALAWTRDQALKHVEHASASPSPVSWEERIEGQQWRLSAHRGPGEGQVTVVASSSAVPKSFPADSDAHFVADLGHDLRTPLNAVLGYSELLSEDLAAHGLVREREDIERVRSAGARLQTVIDDIVDLAKLQAGRTTLHPKPVYARALLEEVVLDLAETSSSNRVRIVPQIDLTQDRIEVDPVRLKQILNHLLGNAVTFTHDGTATIRISKVSAAQQGGSRIRIAVQDTGIGIPEDEVSKVFQPGYRCENGHTRPGRGPGLGLALVRHLVHLMEGDVALQSTLDQGTTVVVTLPLD